MDNYNLINLFEPIYYCFGIPAIVFGVGYKVYEFLQGFKIKNNKNK